MNISRFFIDRPIFAAVLSLIIFISGAIAVWYLPISEYPEVVPPSVVVTAQFPGANPETIANTVAAPLEEAITGVEGALYVSSQGTSDGAMSLTVTFQIGTDPDKAQELVQNRVNQALPRLPDIVRTLGVTTVKSNSDITLVVHLLSPHHRYDTLYLGNYATLNIVDRLSRLNGVGQVRVFGASDYAMRIWLDPDKVAAHGLNAQDVTSAIQAQNVQVAAGIIGAQPAAPGTELQLNVTAEGRLTTPEQFGNIILKIGTAGAVTRLKDVARIELGSTSYSLRSLLDNTPALPIAVFQSPGSNAIAVSDAVRHAMEELKKDFPEDVEYQIVYDPTIFVRSEIHSVIETLLEAIALVVLVVILFLQTWRASIIPLLAVPISIVGTFAPMLAAGFSINALSLFGLVLAIGIVVDDAIVVVENVERNIEEGKTPKEAAYQAMREVSSPIIAIALTLTVVFIPIAFVSGLTGQFYRQFALTIAISTIISAFNSLTLSPAMAAVLLKPHDAEPDALTRVMKATLGWFFDAFNRSFKWSAEKYRNGVARILNWKSVVLVFYVALIGLTGFMFWYVPGGYIPPQDKQFLVGIVSLPSGASLDRTESVIRRMGDIIGKQPGVDHAVQFSGLSISNFTTSPHTGIVFLPLKSFEERKSPDLSAAAIAGKLMAQFGAIKEAFILVIPPPPVNGLGFGGGFKMQIEDRAGLGKEALYNATQQVVNKARQNPLLTNMYSTFEINVPQLYVDIDRTRAEQLGIPVSTIFSTLQVYLGSFYVNDFNQFNRTYQVIAQADNGFRSRAEDISRLKVRNNAGDMVPLGSVLNVSQSFGPENAMRYNGYMSADINGSALPGVATNAAQDAVTQIASEVLPKGMGFEWTELTYQQILAGNTSMYVFPLCVLLVFLVLAAQYESLSLPLAVILIVPMGLLCAISGVWADKGDNNIFTQIGFIVLVGLACKNAILIVEFAREMEIGGASPVEAALEAVRMRLRPILMTSFAFVMGVVPLVLSFGAGAEMRHAMGVAVFSGMLGVTFFGLFLTPIFYVVLRTLFPSRLETASDLSIHTHPHTAEGDHVQH
jgi:multidrug efflux pump